MATEKKFVVLGNFVRQYTRGDVVSAQELGGDGTADPAQLKALTSAMVGEKSIREASAWEARMTSVPVEHVKDSAQAEPPEELAAVIGWKGAKPKPVMAPPALIVPEKAEEKEAPTPTPQIPAPAPAPEPEGEGEGEGAQPPAAVAEGGSKKR